MIKTTRKPELQLHRCKLSYQDILPNAFYINWSLIMDTSSFLLLLLHTGLQEVGRGYRRLALCHRYLLLCCFCENEILVMLNLHYLIAQSMLYSKQTYRHWSRDFRQDVLFRQKQYAFLPHHVRLQSQSKGLEAHHRLLKVLIWQVFSGTGALQLDFQALYQKQN